MYKITILKDGKEVNSFESDEFFISALEVKGKRAAIIAQCGIDFIMQTMEVILKGVDDYEIMTSKELSKTDDIFSRKQPGEPKIRVVGAKDKEE